MNFFKPVDKVAKFEKITTEIAAQGVLTEDKKRTIEEKVLIPDVLKPYTGPLPKHKCALDKRVVRIVFASNKDMDIVNGVLNISESSKGVKYITDISKLVEFCRLMQVDPEFANRFVAITPDIINVDSLDTSDVDELELEEDNES